MKFNLPYIGLAAAFLVSFPLSSHAAISIRAGEQVYYDFNHYFPDYFGDPPQYEFSIHRDDIGTSYSRDAYTPRSGGFTEAQNNDIGDPYGTFRTYTNSLKLNENFPVSIGNPATEGGLGVNLTNTREDDYVWFRATVGPVALRVSLVNTGTEPISGLEISYDAQNITVASGGDFLGSDIQGFENVGLHFFVEQADTQYASPLNFSDTTGIRRTVSAFVPFDRNQGSPAYPDAPMYIIVWQDRSRFADEENAYLFDNLRIRAIAVPEPTGLMLIFHFTALLTLRRRR